MGLWGVSATMPLDVALDARGVTFAGASVAWKDVRVVPREHRHPTLGMTLELVTTGGNVTIGPGARSTLERLGSAIRARTDRREN